MLKLTPYRACFVKNRTANRNFTRKINYLFQWNKE